jgi:hypothetical protein
VPSWENRYQALLSTIEPECEPLSVSNEEGFLKSIALPSESYFPVPGANDLAADEIALRFVERWKDLFMVDHGAMEMLSYAVSESGYPTQVELIQSYAGLPVLVGMMTLDVIPGKGVQALTAHLMADPGPLAENRNLLDPTVSRTEARQLAAQAVASLYPGQHIETQEGELIILASGEPRLMWDIYVWPEGNFRSGRTVWVDAHSGAVDLEALPSTG